MGFSLHYIYLLLPSAFKLYYYLLPLIIDCLPSNAAFVSEHPGTSDAKHTTSNGFVDFLLR